MRRHRINGNADQTPTVFITSLRDTMGYTIAIIRRVNVYKLKDDLKPLGIAW